MRWKEAKYLHVLKAEINLSRALALLAVCLPHWLEHERDYGIPPLLIFRWIVFEN